MNICVHASYIFCFRIHLKNFSMKEKGKGKKFPTRKNLLRLPAGIKIIISLSMLRAALELITAENETHYSQPRDEKNDATTKSEKNQQHTPPPSAVGTFETGTSDYASVTHMCTEHAEPSTSTGITHRNNWPQCSKQKSCCAGSGLHIHSPCCCCKSSQKSRCRKTLPTAISKPISHWFGDIFLTDESKAKLLKEEIKQIRLNQELISSNIETRCSDILNYIDASSSNTEGNQQAPQEGHAATASGNRENNQQPAPGPDIHREENILPAPGTQEIIQQPTPGPSTHSGQLTSTRERPVPQRHHEQVQNPSANPLPGSDNEQIPNTTMHLNTPEDTSDNLSVSSHINVNSLFGSDDDTDDAVQNSRATEISEAGHMSPHRTPSRTNTSTFVNPENRNTENLSMTREINRVRSRRSRRLRARGGSYTATTFTRTPALPVEDPDTGVLDLSQRNSRTNPIYPPFETSSTHEAYENMWLTARPPVVNASIEISEIIRQAFDTGTQSRVHYEPDTSPNFPHLPSHANEAPASNQPISEEFIESGKLTLCTQTISTSVVSTQTETASDTDSDSSSSSSSSSILPPLPQLYYKRKRGK